MPPLLLFDYLRTAFLAGVEGPQYCSRACADEDYGGATFLSQFFCGDVLCALPFCGENALPFSKWRSLYFCCEAHRVMQVSRELYCSRESRRLHIVFVTPSFFMATVKVTDNRADPDERLRWVFHTPSLAFR